MKSNTFWKHEITGGLTTFFTMAYIIAVNPSILSTAGTGLTFSGVLTATVCLCFSMTLLMGLYAKLPFAVAPGMGLNAFFTFSLILGQNISWPIALGLTFWAGVIFIIISITPLREIIASSIPSSLRTAIAAGIGIFLAFLGLKNAGFLVADPVTFVRMGSIHLSSVFAAISFFLMVWLMRRKNPMAFLAGIGLTTFLAGAFGMISAPTEWIQRPDFDSGFFKLDVMGALSLSYLPAILSILFTDLFDSLSTFVGISHATGLVDEKGEPKNLRKGLLVDSLATLFAGLFGTSAGTAYLESSAGIEAGGRTGMASVVTALCFLPCLFIAPAISTIPPYATAPVLVLVGLLMMRGLTTLDLSKMEDAIPACLTMIIIPLTFSITQGIFWGFISHTILYSLFGRRKELRPMMVGLAFLSVSLLWLEHGR